MVRKVIGLVLGVIFLAGAGLIAKTLIENNKRPAKEVPKTVKTVFASPILNTEIPIVIKANGNLVASRKIELYSEVQGVFRERPKAFKSGQAYQKGEVLMDIDSQEFYTSLLAQRSTLYDLITGMMPDIRFDHPESFAHWEAYLQAFDLEKPLSPLPKPISDKEKYFVNGRQIVSTYYTIKNLEERYKKYKIIAPFNGIMTESLVNPGTLIRPGQKLGELVALNDFELEVDIKEQFMDILKVGESVALTDLSGQRGWNGVVKRVNGRIDQSTQSVKVFIGVKGNDLVEGMYLEANIIARSEKEAIEIPRNLLTNEKELFVVENGQLQLKTIEPVHHTDKTVVIKGLVDGTNLLTRPVPGAYNGMLVKISPTTGNIE